MNDFEPKSFTETAVLFSLTGHVFIRNDAPLEYFQQCLKEIHDDDLYTFVMSSVPSNLLESLWETMGSETQDTDPILVQYLCNVDSRLAEIKDYSEKTPYPKSKELIENKFLTNGYMDIEPIDFKRFCEYAENSTPELEEKRGIVKGS